MQHSSEPQARQLVTSMEDLNLNRTGNQLPSHSPDYCQWGGKPPLSSCMACTPTSFPQAYRIPNSWSATSAGPENVSAQAHSARAPVTSPQEIFNYNQELDQEVDAILNQPIWLMLDPSLKMQWKSMMERYSIRPINHPLSSSMECTPTSFPQAYRIPNSDRNNILPSEVPRDSMPSAFKFGSSWSAANTSFTSLQEIYNYNQELDKEVDDILNLPIWLMHDPSMKMQWKSMIDRYNIEPINRPLSSSMTCTPTPFPQAYHFPNPERNSLSSQVPRDSMSPVFKHASPPGNVVTPDWATCKVCRQVEVSVLIIPCNHLCLCKECENKVDVCPICNEKKSSICHVSLS